MLRKFARAIYVMEFRYCKTIFLRFTVTLFHSNLDAKVTSNEKKVASNEQKVASNEQKVTSSEQLGKSSASTLTMLYLKVLRDMVSQNS